MSDSHQSPQETRDAGLEPKDRPDALQRVSRVVRIPRAKNPPRKIGVANEQPETPSVAPESPPPAVVQPVTPPAATPVRDWRKLTVMTKQKHGPALEKPSPAMWLYFTRLKAALALHPDNEQVKKRWTEVRNYIFELHWDDACRIVRTYLAKNMPRYSLVEPDDLNQGAARGLMRCIDKYDITVGTNFMQYANAKKSGLRGAVLDALRELQNCTRLVAQWRRELRPLFAKLTQKLRKPPTIEEFLSHYGTWSEDGRFNYQEILSSREYWSNVFNQSRGGFGATDGSDPLDDMASLTDIEDKHPEGPSGVERGFTIERVLSVIKDQRTRFAVWAYVWGGLTDEEVSRRLSCSPSVASAKRNEGIEILRANFTVEQFRSFIQRSE